MTIYEWAVIGAGPAGIAAVGKLLDQGVPSSKILWIDPEFRVGDFGAHWQNVPSNTKVSLFLKFLHNCTSFKFSEVEKNFELSKLNPEETCHLHFMATPLQWVSDQLKALVNIRQGKVQSLKLIQKHWCLVFSDATEAHAQQVILAIGAESKQLSYTTSAIPVQDAMDSERLKKHLIDTDTVAVFGSSHTAILVLRILVELGVKRIINFYRSPLRYAIYMGDWILFDDTGLKGTTADWAREHIDGVLPKNLERVYSNQENVEHYLPQCQKAIYAVGFERRHLPIIEDIGHVDYIKECGIIAPGLFGFGIAFPEAKYNPFNVLEYRVGLWKFMDYLNRILPVWMKYTP